MPKPNPLHQRVVDNPRDMDSRLVYADWLLEHSDKHGELIQVQFALARDDAKANGKPS